ncbi:MAG: LemA family protein [Synergistaceae bacterium]|jgi:LemA protein|nr:LemA family protein [Synergistaceae bacterium]
MVAVGWISMVCLGVLIIWCIYTYNAFRDRQSMIDFWWDEAEAHLRLRRDLIPSLVDRARPLMASETPTLERIAGIREDIIRDELHPENGGGDDETEHLENKLSAAMLSLSSSFRDNRSVQMNPELLTVMSELVSIEGRAVTACEEYNKLTNDYNSSIKRFPANLVAGMLHFNPREKRIFGTWDEAPNC